jgi:hypothetical protein
LVDDDAEVNQQALRFGWSPVIATTMMNDAKHAPHRSGSIGSQSNAP